MQAIDCALDAVDQLTRKQDITGNIECVRVTMKHDLPQAVRDADYRPRPADLVVLNMDELDNLLASIAGASRKTWAAIEVDYYRLVYATREILREMDHVWEGWQE